MPITRPIVYGEVVPEKLNRLPSEARSTVPGVTVAEDVVLVPGHLFIDRQRGEILPQSYAVTMGGAVTGPESRPPKLFVSPQQAEELFVLESHFTGYGHSLLEAIPRLMLLDRAPIGIEIATSVPRSATFDAIVGAMGIDPLRIRHFNLPVFCRRAYLPDRLVHLDNFIHPLAREAYSRIKVLGKSSSLDRVERIFISRSRIRRRQLSNENEIESLFERYGFRIIHPELLPIEAQIALFSDARMIAGLGGSAMHNTVFTDPDTKVLLVSAKQWFVETDVLINRTAGQLGYVFGEPTDEAMDAGDRTWWVDPAAVEVAIRSHFGL